MPRTPPQLLELTSQIVAAFLAKNFVPVDALPALMESVYKQLQYLDAPPAKGAEMPIKPAVPISKSIQYDHLICLEDGKKVVMLKRYLMTRYDMTPDDYRRRWKLPSNYPMVPKEYSDRRSKMAKGFGLGKTKTKRGPNKPKADTWTRQT